MFDRKRAGVSASSNIGNISNSICTLLLSNVASVPSVVEVEASEVEASEVEAAEVEAAELEAAEVEAAEVETAEVEAVEVEAAEVEVELGDSLTALCAEGKNIRMSEHVVPSSLELQSICDKERNDKDKIAKHCKKQCT